MAQPRPFRRPFWLLAALVAPFPAAGQAIDVVELTVEDVQAGYASRRFTAVGLTRAFLERIERYESRYNAFISMNPEALAIAAALDAEYAATGPRGPLHGVPIVIKDNIDYGGLITTAGWEGFSTAAGGVDMVPSDDAAVVTRLRNAGAIVLGKTNLPDFALNGTRTRSTVAGETLNPYDPEKTPGGSSGGTATAVNASFAVLGLGTETGGSIQNPASAQGLVGLKPTYGLVPLKGVVPVNATYLDVVGPMARTVRDAALALDVIAAEQMPAGGYVAGLASATLRGKRFGLFGQGWRIDRFPLDTLTQRRYDEAVATLVSLGAEVVPDPFHGTGFIELYQNRPDVHSVEAHDLWTYLQGLGDGAAFHTIEEWELRAGLEFRPAGRGQGNGPPVARPSERPADAAESAAYEAWRDLVRDEFHAALERHELDALFFPQSAAPNRNLVEDPARPDYAPNNWPEIPSNVVNDLGVPVVTVPVAYFEDGTPFVVAFIGDDWTEADLLGYAHVLERETRARRPPTLFPTAGS
jgi:Asp-tRNA(Asn)/Glu-tRNA(Gln) amidotransferase A subunit family amidase